MEPSEEILAESASNLVSSPAQHPDAPRSIAPVWHTVVLMACVALLSFSGTKQFTPHRAASVDRLQTYLQTIGMELLMVLWVWFGLRLRKIPFRSLLGRTGGGARAIVIDLGIALVFWFSSLSILGTVGLVWTAADAAVHHRALPQPGKTMEPDADQQKTARTLSSLVPQNTREMTAWVLLCIFVGFAEELVFRGYLQTQFTAWAKGAAAAGVIFSGILFGAAHGYEGLRSMVLLAVFGALFSLLALYRRSLRAGMIAHGWHDLVAGLTIAFLRGKGLI